MNTSKSKPALTIARIVGLVAIGLLVLGLGYLHFGTGDDRVSVPTAAHAGQIDPGAVSLRDRERQLRRRLRHARRAGAAGRSAVRG